VAAIADAGSNIAAIAAKATAGIRRALLRQVEIQVAPRFRIGSVSVTYFSV
jgi:hypothetical protein